jgi:tight adherence protein B
MELLIVGASVFVVLVAVIELTLYGIANLRAPGRHKIKRRLKELKSQGMGQASDIYRHQPLSDIAFLDRLLQKVPGRRHMERLIRQADTGTTLGSFLLTSALLGLTGWIVGGMLRLNPALPVLLALVLGGFPYLHLQGKKSQRIKRFQAQLPEALDLIARALRSGHAFSGGMKLAADEFDAPLGSEFQKTVDEINFGVSVPDALVNLAERLDCTELKFFVVSVILQRETGGNLAEVMETLAGLIRERFKLMGKIRVLSAEGRFSAVVLVAVPLFIFIFLKLKSPDYIGLLFTEPVGRLMLTSAIVMMGLGLLWIRQMINIKV